MPVSNLVIILVITVPADDLAPSGERKHQSSASLAFVGGVHRRPVNSPHIGPVTRKNVSIWWRHHVYAVTPRTQFDVCKENI